MKSLALEGMKKSLVEEGLKLVREKLEKEKATLIEKHGSRYTKYNSAELGYINEMLIEISDTEKMFDVNKIKGYAELSDNNKRLLEEFCKFFYKAWEFPEKHKPRKVLFKRDESNGAYLRVDCSRGEWYHVKSPYTWY